MAMTQTGAQNRLEKRNCNLAIKASLTSDEKLQKFNTDLFLCVENRQKEL